MATTAGALSNVSISSNSVVNSSAVATGGTAPYTYQWYQSTTTGFSPGPTNIVTGATSISNVTFSSLIPNTAYFFKVIATDSSSPAVAGTSSQLAVTTVPTVLQQNVFQQAPIVGMIDQRFDYDTFPCQVDVSAGTALLYSGMAVKIVANTVGGLPRVIACSSKSDNVFGFVNFDIKSVSYGVGQNLEVSQGGNVIWLYTTGAITQGNQVCLDTTASGAVQATGNSATYVGYAVDGAAAAGALIRVKLSNPTFATA
jgi:hypothetical protein